MVYMWHGQAGAAGEIRGDLLVLFRSGDLGEAAGGLAPDIRVGRGRQRFVGQRGRRSEISRPAVRVGYRRDLGEVALAAAHPVHCKVTLLEWEYFAALPRHSLSPLRLGVGSWAVHGPVGATRGMGLWRLQVLGAERGGTRRQALSFFLNGPSGGSAALACGLGLGPRPPSESPGGGQPWC